MYTHSGVITRSFSDDTTYNPLKDPYYFTASEAHPTPVSEGGQPRWRTSTDGTRYLNSVYPGRPWEPWYVSDRSNIPNDEFAVKSDVPPVVAYERCRVAMSSLHMVPNRTADMLGLGYQTMAWRAHEATTLEPPIDDVRDGVMPFRTNYVGEALKQWRSPEATDTR